MSRRKITRIEPQKRRRGRFSIFLDGEFAIGVDAELMTEFGLNEGQMLDDSTLERLRQASELRYAKERAYRLLAARDRSEAELRERLQRIGFGPQVVSEVVRLLKKQDYLDDGRFAVRFARSQLATRPVSRRELERQLRRKGLADADVEEALDRAFAEKGERKLAFELAYKRKRRYRSETDEAKVKKKVTDFLARRGFDWEVIREVLEHWAELGERQQVE